MAGAAPTIAEGDIVIMYGGMVKRKQIYNTKHGSFLHDDLIGKPFGSKLFSRQGGWMCALRPSPELWTAGALQHRTQIIYTMDISMITLYLELRPGSVVVESGTGSGSLSRALARTIAPDGRLFTFEFHEQRALLARQTFEESQLGGVITVTCRDVCELGYGLAEGTANAVMLDLPCPWLAIPHAANVLKHYGMLCNFSPCIEQVQKAAEALAASGFSEIKTIECLVRPFEVRPMGFVPVPPEPAKRAQVRTDTPSKAEAPSKRPRSPSGVPSAAAVDDQEEEGKDEESGSSSGAEEEAKPAAPIPEPPSPAEAPTADAGALNARAPRPQTVIRGHTSYLTFARRLNR